MLIALVIAQMANRWTYLTQAVKGNAIDGAGSNTARRQRKPTDEFRLVFAC